MLKRFVSMFTAAFLVATGLSIVSASSASAITPDLDCSTIVSQQVVFLPMTGNSKDVTLSGSCVMLYGPVGGGSGLTLTPVTNSELDLNGNGYASQTTANTSWTVNVSGTPVSAANPTTNNARLVLKSSSNVFSRVQFVTPEFYANADLTSLSIGATLTPTFSSSTTSYTATTSTSFQIAAVPAANRLGENGTKNALVGSAACDGASVSLTVGTPLGQYNGSCSLSVGSNKIITLTVTALDGVTTKTYTITATASSGGGGGGGGGLPACNADLLSPSSTIKGVPITIGQSRSSAQFSAFYTPGPLRSSVNLTEAQATGSGTTSITTTDGSAVFWLYLAPGINSFSHQTISGNSNQSAQSVVSGRDFIIRVVPQTCAEQYYWVSITVGSGSSSPTAPTAQQLAAIQAAIQAAIVKAKTTLHGTLQGDKPGTLDQYRAADYKVNNDKVVEKVNAAVLKLPLADREKAEKIAAIIKVENFVDLVSTPATQKRVSSKALVELGLVAADNPNKTTIANALKKADAATLDSIEKIQEAIKAELAAVKERKDLLAQIKAKIAARKK